MNQFIDENNKMIINFEIDNLFEYKYNKNGKYVKFIYNEYNISNKTRSEFASFLMINTIDQKLTIAKNKDDIFTFLNLSDEDKINLKNDISLLLKKEEDFSSSKRKLIILFNYLYN